MRKTICTKRQQTLDPMIPGNPARVHVFQHDDGTKRYGPLHKIPDRVHRARSAAYAVRVWPRITK